MQPASYNFAVSRGDSVAVTFRFSRLVDGSPVALDLANSEIELLLAWPHGSIMRSTAEGELTIVPGTTASEVAWTATPEQTGRLPSGAVTRYWLTRTDPVNGRRTYVTGLITANARGSGAGDIEPGFVVNDNAVVFDISVVGDAPSAAAIVDRVVGGASAQRDTLAKLAAILDGVADDTREALRVRPLKSQLSVNLFDYGTNVGTGGDDSAAFNAAIAAAIAGPSKAGRLVVPTPPSGFYNIDASPIELPGLGSLVIDGPGLGATVRRRPGSTSGITSILHQTINTSQKARIRLNNLTIDGLATVPTVVDVEYAVGWTAQNCTFRNAAPGGQTVWLRSGYEFSIGEGCKIENVNDPGSVLYGAASDLPDYALRMGCTDSYFTGLIVINAKAAYVFNENGGGNNYIGTHVWGYPSDPINKADLRADIGYLVNGKANLTGAISDNFKTAGISLRVDAFGGGAMVLGCQIIGTNVPGAAGILLAAGLPNTTVIGNNVTGVQAPATNGIVAQGALGANTVVRHNPGAGFETTVDLKNVVGGDTLHLESFALGGGVALQARSPAANSGVFITAKGGGSVALQSNGQTAFSAFNPANAVNRLQASGNTTGFPVDLQAVGSDANIDLQLSGKGTGVLRFGSFTASADAAVNGYISIKDAAGNVRKLATIA